MGVRCLTEPLPVRRQADDDAIVLTNSREKGHELVLFRGSLIQDEGARDGEVQVRRCPLATSGEPGGVDFMPINLGHNS